MIKRFLTLVSLSTLLLASTPSTPTIKAFPRGGQKSSDAQARARVEHTLQEAGKSATYDQAGRVKKLTLAVSDNKNVSFSFVYDERGRVQYIVQEDGTRMQLKYDSAGQWQGVIFPDGGSMTLERDRAGNVIGLHTEKPAGHKTSQLNGAGTHGARLRKASAALFDDCKAAVDRATDAAIGAAIACLPGPSAVCAAAVAWAAYTGYLAYKACGGGDAMLEEEAY
ncbi:MAG: YD repeat-containing protein [Acidobacteriota bacterium]|nr:YD repeat-containing protein [Acidobacteriota bacterium]MDQ5836856.1 YD repeat-containing protein [Acidobacteriota bacterium]